MSHEFMTTEGDRSGVATPSKDEKAHNRLKALIVHLQTVDRDWDRVSTTLRSIAISEARHNLASVVTILMGGEGET
jgi:hypothetical protein